MGGSPGPLALTSPVGLHRLQTQLPQDLVPPTPVANLCDRPPWPTSTRWRHSAVCRSVSGPRPFPPLPPSAASDSAPSAASGWGPSSVVPQGAQQGVSSSAWEQMRGREGRGAGPRVQPCHRVKNPVCSGRVPHFTRPREPGGQHRELAPIAVLMRDKHLRDAGRQVLLELVSAHLPSLLGSPSLTWLTDTLNPCPAPPSAMTGPGLLPCI